MTKSVAVVTGASSGVGEATVRRLALSGYSVVAVARRAGALEWGDADVVNEPCDLRDEDATARLGERVLARLGRIDCLVNGAGLLRDGRIGSLVGASIREQIAVNLLGAMLAVESCVEALRQSAGVVLNVSSVLVERPTPGLSVYVATKGAIEAYTRALAVELSPSGARANTLRLGLVRTPIHLAAGRSVEESEEIFRRGAERIPLGRVGSADEVAKVIAFLVGEGTAWMTGATVTLDGGRLVG